MATYVGLAIALSTLGSELCCVLLAVLVQQGVLLAGFLPEVVVLDQLCYTLVGKLRRQGGNI